MGLEGKIEHTQINSVLSSLFFLGILYVSNTNTVMFLEDITFTEVNLSCEEGLLGLVLLLLVAKFCLNLSQYFLSLLI